MTLVLVLNIVIFHHIKYDCMNVNDIIEKRKFNIPERTAYRDLAQFDSMTLYPDGLYEQ